MDIKTQLYYADLMVALKPLSPVIPVFILIGIGFCFAQWKKISLEPVTELVIYLLAPCLVFTSLATRPLALSDIAIIQPGPRVGCVHCLFDDSSLLREHPVGLLAGSLERGGKRLAGR